MFGGFLSIIIIIILKIQTLPFTLIPKYNQNSFFFLFHILAFGENKRAKNEHEFLFKF